MNVFPSVMMILYLSAVPAFAALGGDAASIDSDVAQMRASRGVEQTDAYTVHQLKTQSGTMVREYLSPSG
ncbi:MAG: DUF2844 domain-containing protein, partial [Terriglobales bacterium]